MITKLAKFRRGRDFQHGPQVDPRTAPCNDNRRGRLRATAKRLRPLFCRWHKTPNGALECRWHSVADAASDEPGISRRAGLRFAA